MTSRETLALVAVGLPALTAVVVALSPRRAVQPLALAGLVATGVAAITLGGPGAREPRGARGHRLGRDRRRGRPDGRRGRRRRPGERPRVARVSLRRPARPLRPLERCSWLLRRARGVRGRADRRPARRQPGCRVAPRRGDHRRVGHPRRLQRQAAGARGGLEVPAAHLAGPRLLPAGHRVARVGHDGRHARPRSRGGRWPRTFPPGRRRSSRSS